MRARSTRSWSFTGSVTFHAQRLDGVLAFDPNRIVDLISLDQLAALSSDESAAVRQLVATVLSRNAEPKWTDTLIKLVKDTDAEAARQAAPGLGKIGDERSREPLLSALGKADKESRKSTWLRCATVSARKAWCLRFSRPTGATRSGAGTRPSRSWRCCARPRTRASAII